MNVETEYEVKFKCSNCEYIFSKVLPKGSPALGSAGICPKCGCNQETVGRNGQKVGVFQIVPEDEDQKDGTPLEILLEKDGSLKVKKIERSKR